MGEERKNVGWCLIPPWVIADTKLTLADKVVCGRVWSLSNAQGYCYASNRWLGEQLGLASGTVSNSLASLAARGYVRVEIKRDENKEVVSRYVYPIHSPVDTSPPQDGDLSTPQWKEVEEIRSKSRGTTKTGSANADRPKRSAFKVPSETMTNLVDSYKRLKGVELHGDEHLPIQQAMKSMLMDGNTPEQIKSLMEALCAATVEWAQGWTYLTVRRKLPEWRAGKLKLSTNGKRGNALVSGVDYGTLLEGVAKGAG